METMTLAELRRLQPGKLERFIVVKSMSAAAGSSCAQCRVSAAHAVVMQLVNDETGQTEAVTQMRYACARHNDAVTAAVIALFQKSNRESSARYRV